MAGDHGRQGQQRGEVVDHQADEEYR
jgi:hypothetical protein